MQDKQLNIPLYHGNRSTWKVSIILISMNIPNEKGKQAKKKIFPNRIIANAVHILRFMIWFFALKISNRLWNIRYLHRAASSIHDNRTSIWILYCINCGPPAVKGRSKSICSIVLVPIPVERKMKFVFGSKSGNTSPSFQSLNCRHAWNIRRHLLVLVHRFDEWMNLKVLSSSSL